MSAGSSCGQSEKTYGQRGWNGQPVGTRMRLGGLPAIGWRRSLRGVSSRGIDWRSPHVYGCWGVERIVASGPRSATRPAYMTATSSAVSATTPRSCVINMTAIPLTLEVADELEDLRLDRDVQRRRRLVGDEDVWIEDERHRDHRPLAHPTGELVRKAVEPLGRVRDPDFMECRQRAPARLGAGDVLVGQNRLLDLPSHLVEGMEGGHRVLEDHRDVLAADALEVA